MQYYYFMFSAGIDKNRWGKRQDATARGHRPWWMREGFLSRITIRDNITWNASPASRSGIIPLESFVILHTNLCILETLDCQNELSVWQIMSPYLMSLGAIGVWANKQPRKIYKKWDACLGRFRGSKLIIIVTSNVTIFDASRANRGLGQSPNCHRKLF